MGSLFLSIEGKFDVEYFIKYFCVTDSMSSTGNGGVSHSDVTTNFSAD